MSEEDYPGHWVAARLTNSDLAAYVGSSAADVIATAGQEHAYDLRHLAHVNLCVGPNNSGKSRFLRLLATGVDFGVKTSLRHAAKKGGISEEPGLSEAMQATAKFSLPPQSSSTGSATPARVYIPPLRTLRIISHSTSRELAAYFEKAYGFKPDSDLEIFTGHSVYTDLLRHATGGRKSRDLLARFEDFVSKSCFSGRSVSVSPRASEGTIPEHVEIQVGDDEPHRIEDLGDGIAQVVLLAFPVFFNQKRVFLIEEPETHLHPGLQRALLRLFSEAVDAVFFVATHSNHLIDMALEEMKDCAVLRFRKQGPLGTEGSTFQVTRVDPGDAELLHDLGVQVSSVARVNCTLWVEGITDRDYLRRMLDLYQADEKPKQQVHEHLHYAFVTYGGDNVRGWKFKEDGLPDEILASRIAGTPVLLVDSDGGRKRARDERLQEQLGDRFHRTAGREVENMLPASSLRAVLQSYGEERSVVEEAVPSEGQPWKDSPLGSWINKRFADAGVTPKRRGGYAAENGTLKDKRAFCKKALPAVTRFAALPRGTQKLIRELHRHIVDANGL